jgi:hypothetical protein
MLAQTGQIRYEYSIKRIADAGELWSLKDPAGWRMQADDAGNEVVPIWPHRLYAEAAAIGAIAGSTAAPIDLQTWRERWIPGLIRDRRLVGVFPVPDGQSVVVEPKQFDAHLQIELDKIE